MTEQMAPSLDFEAMRRAIEGSDYEALVSFYVDDAELRMVNKNSTPSSPMVLRSKEEISEMVRDMCGAGTRSAGTTRR
jgi:ketosteroid isomerase-like protein